MRAAGARQGQPSCLATRALALAMAAGLTLGATACSDDSPDTSNAGTVPPGPAPREPSEVGEGCGDRATTDPSDLRANRVVARCGSGSPEARPLPARTPLRVAVPRQAGEEQAPVLLAHELGEFEDENLAVELVERDPVTAMADLAAGRVDVVVGPLGGAFFDAVHDRTGARVVLGGVLSRAPNRLRAAQTGLWMRRDAVADDTDLGDLQSQSVGVPGGVGGSALYPVSHVLEQRNAMTENASVVDVSGDEAAEQLTNGELAAAWLDEASWLSVAGESGYVLLATLPASESIDGTVFSRRLTAENREVGLAYVRAVIRTINTALSGDYQSDEDVVAALARATGLDEDAITDTRPLLFDWEIRNGTLSRIEDVLLTAGGVSYESAQPREDLVDRTLVADAVSAPG